MIRKKIKRFGRELLRVRNILRNLGIIKGLKYILFLSFTKLIYDKRHKFVLTKETLQECKDTKGLIIKNFTSYDLIPEKDKNILKKRMIFTSIIHIKHHLEKTGNILWIAYANSNVVGLAWSRTNEKTALIFECETFVEYRGKGYFTSLLTFVCKKLFEEKVDYIRCTVHVFNKSSIAAFKGVGFKQFETACYNKFCKLVNNYFPRK